LREIWSSAAYRIAFAYTAAFSVMVAGLGTVVFFAADANFRSQQDAAIAAESDELVHEYRNGGLAELRENILRREADSIADAFGYAVFQADGRRIVGQLDTSLPAAGWQNIVFNGPADRSDPARALTTPLSHGLILVVALNNDAVEQIDKIILVLFTGALAVMILLGTGGAIILGAYIRRRLERISGTAQAILAGELNRRIPTKPAGDEFDRLGRSLNAMLDRISELLENLRQVSSDVAHDLRTPLTRLRGEIDAAIEGAANSDLQQAALERALEQSDRLLSLFSAILRISEVEGGDVARSFARIDLSVLVADLCDSYCPVVQDGGRSLTCRVMPAVEIVGDRELISQAIVNLLDNAQIHTPAGTNIVADVVTASGNAMVRVADNGPGVPMADQRRILKRFVRLDVSRTTSGNGLGLNLVSAIATAHGGSVTIADNAPGLRVSINLPLLRPAA